MVRRNPYAIDTSNPMDGGVDGSRIPNSSLARTPVGWNRNAPPPQMPDLAILDQQQAQQVQSPITSAQQFGNNILQEQANIAAPGYVRPTVNLFSGNPHPDTGFTITGRTAENADQFDYWKAQTKIIGPQLDQALARLGTAPKSVADIQELMAANNISPNMGQFVEDHVSNYLEKANPALAKQIHGQLEVDRMNKEAGTTMYQYDPIAKQPVMTATGEATQKAQLVTHARTLEEADLLRQAQESGGTLVAKRTATGLKLFEQADLTEKAQAKAQEVFDKTLKRNQDRITALEKSMEKDQALVTSGAMLQPQFDARNGGKIKERDGLVEKIVGMTAGEGAGAIAANLPVLTPDQARTSPPGTKFRTTDGRTGTVPGAPASATSQTPTIAAPETGIGTITTREGNTFKSTGGRAMTFSTGAVPSSESPPFPLAESPPQITPPNPNQPEINYDRIAGMTGKATPSVVSPLSAPAAPAIPQSQTITQLRTQVPPEQLTQIDANVAQLFPPLQKDANGREQPPATYRYNATRSILADLGMSESGEVDAQLQAHGIDKYKFMLKVEKRQIELWNRDRDAYMEKSLNYVANTTASHAKNVKDQEANIQREAQRKKAESDRINAALDAL